MCKSWVSNVCRFTSTQNQKDNLTREWLLLLAVTRTTIQSGVPWTNYKTPNRHGPKDPRILMGCIQPRENIFKQNWEPWSTILFPTSQRLYIMKRIPNNLNFNVLLNDTLEYVESQRQIDKRMINFIQSQRPRNAKWNFVNKIINPNPQKPQNHDRKNKLQTKLATLFHNFCFQLHEGLTSWKTEPYLCEFQCANVEWNPASA